jgi:4-aminobutyrate aminotransferase-like enzyme
MMSQFLDCFSETEIIHILKEVQEGLIRMGQSLF